MSEYGLKIMNYQAGSVFEVQCGVRENYDTQNAMLTNSLFSDFIRANGLKDWKGKSTRDIICMEFDYGSRTFDQEMAHLQKMQANLEEQKEELSCEEYEHKAGVIKSLMENAEVHKNNFVAMSADELRTKFYTEGVTIRYPLFDRNKKIKDYEYITYKMLYRTPGKAKKGSCMFIRKSLYNRAHDFLWMGLKLPKRNAPVVEIGAYSSLITSTIEAKIQIRPEDILIIKDVDAFATSDVISVELDSEHKCRAVKRKNYQLVNTMFDGQALIDSGIFPSWGNGYILLRQHFTKVAAFNTNIQQYFHDYYGDTYETATVKDMWGNEHCVKDIKMITTENAIKWAKFGVSYEYWCDWVHKSDDMFGIVKTAHPSKLGDVQRMSYQMVNALTEDIMDDVLAKSKEYIHQLKTNDQVFFDYLRKASNFSNDYEVLIALCKHNPEFTRCDYYRSRKKEIIRSYVNNLKNGRAIQNADNLTIVGSPYALLLAAVGEDPLSDPTFDVEDTATQCYTERFDDGEYLAEFRSPFNSPNNMGYLHNKYHPLLKKYFNLGRLCIAVNMNGTSFQERNNGSDQDSDSIYTTNQPQIVARAKYCTENYLTIVNNIPKDGNHYDNTLEDFAKIDNKLAAAQLDIGESSNLAQICLSYTYNFPDERFAEYVCILSVVAQIAIDNAKRSFDITPSEEIKRIKKDINLTENKYPAFWMAIHHGFKFENINKHLRCPMNSIYNIKLESYKPETSTLPFSDFYVRHDLDGSKKMAKSVQNLIERFSFELSKYNISDDMDKEDYLLLRSDFDDMIAEIRKISLSEKYAGIVSWLIARAFLVTPQIAASGKMRSRLDKNKSLLLKVLYEVNQDTLLKTFKNTSVLGSEEQTPVLKTLVKKA